MPQLATLIAVGSSTVPMEAIRLVRMPVTLGNSPLARVDSFVPQPNSCSAAKCSLFDHPSELADANNVAVWNVGHPGLANDGRHVMLAMALETNATQHDHFVIAFDFLEGLLQDLGRILGIADEKLFERALRGRKFSRKPSRSGSSPVHRITVRNPASASARSGRSISVRRVLTRFSARTFELIETISFSRTPERHWSLPIC